MDWRPITIGETNDTFLISIKRIKSESDGNFVFNLSNFKELWRETIDWQEILRRAKSENLFMNVDGEENAIERTIFSLANQYSFNTNENESLLKTKYYIGVPFHFTWKLTKSNSDVFYEVITRQLLVTLLNVQDQKNELIDIVKRKDVEINQYKVEGATLMRKHIATQPFLKPEFDRKYELVSGLFELTKDDMDNWTNVKNMCNYDSFTKAEEKNVSANMLVVSQGPSPSKISKHKKNKEENAIRKFNTKKECKITYESSCELLMSDDNEETELDTNIVADIVKADAITESKKEQPKEIPKRKQLKTKLNL